MRITVSRMAIEHQSQRPIYLKHQARHKDSIYKTFRGSHDIQSPKERLIQTDIF